MKVITCKTGSVTLRLGYPHRTSCEETWADTSMSIYMN